MFMDAIGMLVLTLPVVYPAVVALGYDPIWFGIVVVKMAEICLITPPIGLNCFVVAGVARELRADDGASLAHSTTGRVPRHRAVLRRGRADRGGSAGVPERCALAAADHGVIT